MGDREALPGVAAVIVVACHVFPDWQRTLHNTEDRYCQCEPEIRIVEEMNDEAHVVILHSVLGKAVA